MTVHPRARGEHFTGGPNQFDGGGSSPRSRGTRGGLKHWRGPGRFIPALAGNTFWTVVSAIIISVHPRARGEHWSITRHATVVRGSSPRSRGTHRRQNHRHNRHRFIPALAGNTPHLLDGQRRHRFIPALAGNTNAWHRGLLQTSVHPRARGEHSPGRDPLLPRPGSSPRSRGTRFSYPIVLSSKSTALKFHRTFRGMACFMIAVTS